MKKLAWIVLSTSLSVFLPTQGTGQALRARDLGIPFDGTPGPLNAITDVEGIMVGHVTLIEGEAGPLVVGQGPIRTGVTAILPRGPRFAPIFAGWYSLNGNGEMTGTTWVEESGFLEGPVMITNTHSVGVVRDGVLDEASPGPVAEGGVGGGTGMICNQFKGGIGTSSRRVGDYTVGVLVQCNYGGRTGLRIAGVPVGREITDLMPEYNRAGEPQSDQAASPTQPTLLDPAEAFGSIIVVVATDAPLLPHQLKRLARRVPIGIGRMGGYGSNGSGDVFIAFSTANEGAWDRSRPTTLKMLPNDRMSPFLLAKAEATEEAIVNAMVAGETMEGINGNRVHALPHDRVRAILERYGRLNRPTPRKPFALPPRFGPPRSPSVRRDPPRGGPQPTSRSRPVCPG